MNQAEIRKLIPALRVTIRAARRGMSNPEGPDGRLRKLRATVTELIKNERIELNFNRADEARGYAERVSSGNYVDIINSFKTKPDLTYTGMDVRWTTYRISPPLRWLLEVSIRAQVIL